MTSKVTIQVPESANYCVKVETTNYTSYMIYSVMPGDTYTIYIHSDLKVLGIEEHKIGE